MSSGSYRTRMMKPKLRTTNEHEGFVCPNGRTRRTCGGAQQASRGDAPGVRLLCEDCQKKFLLTTDGWTSYG